MKQYLERYASLVEPNDERQPFDVYAVNTPWLRLCRPPQSNTELWEYVNVLKKNGILYNHSTKDSRRRYRFYIFDMECFGLFQAVQMLTDNKPLLIQQRSKKVKWRKMAIHTSSREISKARKLAARALYVLGYDIGVVDISVINQKPRYAVSRISNKWVDVQEMKENLQQLVNSYQNSLDMPLEQMKMGADLEMVLRHDDGRYVLASRFFSKTGKVGYDAIWLRGNRGKYPIVELRPAPQTDPLALNEEIEQCLRNAHRTINNTKIKWLAGGKPMPGYPIGGHIHFSGIPMQSRLIRALDNYVTLPLSLLESKVSHSRRPKYGFLGDVRQQFHGGFEYRTPPSWIVSPTVAKGVLASAKVVAHHYRELEWMPLNDYELQQDFYDGKVEVLRPIVLELWQSFRRCGMYNTYADVLDAYFELVKTGNSWDEYEDIRKAWGISPFKGERVV